MRLVSCIPRFYELNDTLSTDQPENQDNPAGADRAADAFDLLYLRWAETALNTRQGAPSRERWDELVLRLISSLDPDRVRLYRRIGATGEDSLGADAYDLWRKMPDYTPGLHAPAKTWPELAAYAEAHRGSMRRLMQARGLGDKYNSAVAGQPGSHTPSLESQPLGKAVDRVQARRAQTRIMLIGCVGMMALLFMVLTVLLIIALKALG